MNKNNSSKNKIANIGIASDVNAKVTFHHNVDQNIITITEDKVEIILKEYLEKIATRNLGKTLLSILIPLIFIPITTEKFSNAFGIDAIVWKILIYLVIFILVVFLVVLSPKFWKNRRISINEIIEAMKRKNKSSV